MVGIEFRVYSHSSQDELAAMGVTGSNVALHEGLAEHAAAEILRIPPVCVIATLCIQDHPYFNKTSPSCSKVNYFLCKTRCCVNNRNRRFKILQQNWKLCTPKYHYFAPKEFHMCLLYTSDAADDLL